MRVSPRHRWAILGQETFLRIALFLCASLTLDGCILRREYPPRQAVIERVDIEGLDEDEVRPLLDGLATVGSPKFLGLWDGVAFEYEVFDAESLKQDLMRVERYLAARGYFEAKVTAARVIAVDEHRVRVEIRVRQGVPVITRAVSFDGLERVPIEVAVRALSNNSLRAGKPFDESAYEATKRDAAHTLHDLGYAFAQVNGQVSVDIAAHQADVHFTVTPGDTAVYGEVTVRGLVEIPEHVVRDQVSLRAGSAFSQSELDDARKALTALGVFADVRIKADLERATGDHVPIVITVEEAHLRSVRIGVGAALDSLQTETHLGVSWENRNFLGGARHLALGVKPGLVFFPTRFGNFVLPNRELFRGQINANLRQPSLLEGRTTGILGVDFNLYPLLYAQSDENSPVVGFAELKTNLGLQRAFLSQRLLVSPSYNWKQELPIDYRHLSIGREINAADELLSRLIIAYPELVISLDKRDDVLTPHSGWYSSLSVQWASPYVGSDVSDVRVAPELRGFVPISGSVTLATRVRVGWLLGRDYALERNPEDQTLQERRAVALDQQKLLFRGFFSGGANSNRGYPESGVGPRGEVLFLTPNAEYCALLPSERQCNEPLGGISLWEASLEVRFPIWDPLGGVWFVDSSNVNDSERLDFTAPHVSSGLGIRYETPIGPVRLDTGFRIPYLQVLGKKGPSDASLSNPWIPGVHLTLGEAF